MPGIRCSECGYQASSSERVCPYCSSLLNGATASSRSDVERFIRRELAGGGPEKKVVRELVRRLAGELGYSVDQLRAELPVRFGSRGGKVDIALFAPGDAHSPERAQVFIECKREGVRGTTFQTAVEQLKSYMSASANVRYGVAYSGDQCIVLEKMQGPSGLYESVEIGRQLDCIHATRVLTASAGNSAPPWLASARPISSMVFPSAATSAPPVALGPRATAPPSRSSWRSWVAGASAAAVAGGLMMLWLGGSSHPIDPARVRVNCSVPTLSAVRLRSREALNATGPEYPVGTSMQILRASSVTSRGSRLFYVRVESNGALGWVLLNAGEVSPCTTQ